MDPSWEQLRTSTTTWLRLVELLALNELFCAITGEDIQKNKITTIVTPVLVPGELRNTNPASGHDGSGVFREFSTRDNR